MNDNISKQIEYSRGDLAHEITLLTRFQKNIITKHDISSLSTDDNIILSKYINYSTEELAKVLAEKRSIFYKLG